MTDPMDRDETPGSPGAADEPSTPGAGEDPAAPGGTGPGSTGPVQGPLGAGGGSGLEPNLAGALAYLLGPVTGVLFLVVDKERPFVRFHAMQCIVLSVAWVAVWIVLSVLTMILSALPIIGWLIGLLLTVVLGIGGLVLWLLLMFKAYQGEEWELPVLGEQARRLGSEVNL